MVSEAPLDETRIRRNGDIDSVADDRCRLLRPVQGRCDDRDDGALRQSFGHAARLFPAVVAQAKPGKGGIDDMIGVVDLAVANQV